MSRGDARLGAEERAAPMSRSSRPVRAPEQFTNGLSRVPIIERMTIRRMEHVGIVVELAEQIG